jgi:ribonucleoside-diphosphate reductase alpha chain
MATDILAQKYFRKTGVPQIDENGNFIREADGSIKTGSETSIKQVVKRIAGCWRHWGEKYGYFESKEDAKIFEDEISYMLLNQMVAPNSPQWFKYWTGICL